MFIGHFAAGLAAKPLAPRTSLGTLLLACQFLDLLWPTLLLLGLEQVRIVSAPDGGLPLVFEHYPVSHSLLAAAGWGLLLGAIVWLLRRDRRGALVVAALVVSHWLLDAVVHVPDLPLWPGPSPRIGLALWHAPMLALALELALFAVGALLYLRTTRARDRTGRWSVAGLLVALVAIQFANAAGDAPPSVAAIAWVGQAQWLFVGWGYWIDAHREAISADRPPATVPSHVR